MWLELHQLSSGIYVVACPNAKTDIPQRFSYKTIVKLV
jgi:hypothetical protein